jgi:hypothetical protein
MKERQKRNYIREDPAKIVNTKGLKSVQNVSRYITKAFKHKIKEANYTLTQMRAGSKISNTNLFMPYSNTEVLYSKPYDKETTKMLVKIDDAQADNKTKVLKQYDTLMQCLNYKDEIVRKKNRSETRDASLTDKRSVRFNPQILNSKESVTSLDSMQHAEIQDAIYFKFFKDEESSLGNHDSNLNYK